MRRYHWIAARLGVMLQRLAAPVRGREEGQTLAEYALILAVVGVAVFAAIIFLGDHIRNVFTQIGSRV